MQDYYQPEKLERTSGIQSPNNIGAISVFVLVLIFTASGFWAASAQRALTYPEIMTALASKLPNRSFKTKRDLIKFLITQIRQRRVDKPLTESREDDLRQAGATSELIDAIRANSLPLPMPLPTATPETTATPPAKPLITPSSTPIKLRPLSELLKTAPKPGEVRKNSIGMELVWIRHGEFMMGADSGDGDERPVHTVNISFGFWIGKNEVTQAQYEKVIGINPSSFKGCSSCPVEQVSWNDAKEFITQLNAKNDGFVYSLPTEAQWEYAARAGATGMYAGNLNEMAWYSETSGLKTHAVGTKRPNLFGLFDMSGNVWEWCDDWYGSYETSTAINPTGPVTGEYRVLRGGSWLDDSTNAGLAVRGKYLPTNRYNLIGFRVVARPK